MEIIEKENGLFSNTAKSNEFLVPAHPAYVGL
jgi:hypothetical protein